MLLNASKLGSIFSSGRNTEFKLVTRDQIILDVRKQTEVNVTQFSHVELLYTFGLNSLRLFFSVYSDHYDCRLYQKKHTEWMITRLVSPHDVVT